MKAYHSRVAQTAPPEVPLMATTWKSWPSLASQSFFRAPAVKAVWLPPPWQAIAILSLGIQGSPRTRAAAQRRRFARAAVGPQCK